MPSNLQAIGAVMVVLAAVHAVFPRYFDWKTDLSKLSLINRQVMEVHTFFIALAVFLMGLVCLLEADALVETPLGRHVAAGLAIFWGARLLAQLFWYSPQLWRKKRFETAVHILFTTLWLWFTASFVATWQQL